MIIEAPLTVCIHVTVLVLEGPGAQFVCELVAVQIFNILEGVVGLQLLTLGVFEASWGLLLG